MDAAAKAEVKKAAEKAAGAAGVDVGEASDAIKELLADGSATAARQDEIVETSRAASAARRGVVRAGLKMVVLGLDDSASPSQLLSAFPTSEQAVALFDKATGERLAVVLVFAAGSPPAKRTSAALGCRLQTIVQMPEAGNDCTRMVWARDSAARAVRYD